MKKNIGTFKDVKNLVASYSEHEINNLLALDNLSTLGTRSEKIQRLARFIYKSSNR